MADNSKLMAELNALVESRTFTAEAAAGIARLRDRVMESEDLIKSLSEQLGEKIEEAKTLREDKDKLRGSLVNWQAREEALIKREADMTKLEKSLAVAEAKALAFDTINQRMLANRIMREEIQQSRQVPIAQGSGGYVSTYSQTESNSRSVREE